jgi:hypothetical protein
MLDFLALITGDSGIRAGAILQLYRSRLTILRSDNLLIQVANLHPVTWSATAASLHRQFHESDVSSFQRFLGSFIGDLLLNPKLKTSAAMKNMCAYMLRGNTPPGLWKLDDK